MKKKNKSSESVISIPLERTATWQVAARIIGVCLLLARLGLTVTGLFGYRLLIGTRGQGALLEQGILFFLLDALILLCAVFSIRFKKKLWYVVPGLAAAILLLIYGTNIAAYSRDRSYTGYSSPNGENTLVMEADASMFSGRIRFYRRVNAIFLKDTGEGIQLDDGFQAFINTPILVEWPEENLARVTSWVNGQEKAWEINFS